MNTTTTGVLFTKAESTTTIGSMSRSTDQSDKPTIRFNRSAITSITPVRSSAALSMNMHATAMAASLPNTRNVSDGVRMPEMSKALNASMATTSGKNFSHTINPNVPEMMMRTSERSKVMPG